MSDVTVESRAAEDEGAAGPNICTTAERTLAAATWLLAAARSTAQAIAEWRDSGAAWMLPGALFAAVFVPAEVVHAALGVKGPRHAAALLSEELDGPVFYRPQALGRGDAYVVLLPASAARTWRAQCTVVHAPRALLLVPSPDRTEPSTREPWWVLPPDGPGTLCTPDLLASLVSRASAHRTGVGCDD